MMLLADYTHEEIIQILYNKYNIKLSKSQLRTKIKHIAKQLKNPITVVDKRTKSVVCAEKKKILQSFQRTKAKRTDIVQDVNNVIKREKNIKIKWEI